MRGTSLSGLIEPGATVRILYGSYDCTPVQREDVVAYKYGGNQAPIVKVVKGLPGDSFDLVIQEGYQLRINGQIVTNSRKEPYLLDDHAYRVLSLYVRD